MPAAVLGALRGWLGRGQLQSSASAPDERVRAQNIWVGGGEGCVGVCESWMMSEKSGAGKQPSSLAAPGLALCLARQLSGSARDSTCVTLRHRSSSDSESSGFCSFKIRYLTIITFYMLLTTCCTLLSDVFAA